MEPTKQTTAKSLVMKPLFRPKVEQKDKGKGSYKRKQKHKQEYTDE